MSDMALLNRQGDFTVPEEVIERIAKLLCGLAYDPGHKACAGFAFERSDLRDNHAVTKPRRQIKRLSIRDVGTDSLTIAVPPPLGGSIYYQAVKKLLVLAARKIEFMLKPLARVRRNGRGAKQQVGCTGSIP